MTNPKRRLKLSRILIHLPSDNYLTHVRERIVENPINPIPYAMGSAVFPGLAKVLEEMNELGEVLSKILMTGSLNHWHGDLTDSLIEELGDVCFAVGYFVDHNLGDGAKVVLNKQIEMKQAAYAHFDAVGDFTP